MTNGTSRCSFQHSASWLVAPFHIAWLTAMQKALLVGLGLRRNKWAHPEKGKIMWACLGWCCPRRVFSLKVCFSILSPQCSSLSNRSWHKWYLHWSCQQCVILKMCVLVCHFKMENINPYMASPLSSSTLPSCPPHSPTYNSSSCLPPPLSIHREIIISKFVINLSVPCSSGSSPWITLFHLLVRSVAECYKFPPVSCQRTIYELLFWDIDSSLRDKI